MDLAEPDRPIVCETDNQLLWSSTLPHELRGGLHLFDIAIRSHIAPEPRLQAVEVEVDMGSCRESGAGSARARSRSEPVPSASGTPVNIAAAVHHDRPAVQQVGLADCRNRRQAAVALTRDREINQHDAVLLDDERRHGRRPHARTKDFDRGPCGAWAAERASALVADLFGSGWLRKSDRASVPWRNARQAYCGLTNRSTRPAAPLAWPSSFARSSGEVRPRGSSLASRSVAMILKV
jgi:hypothetical protein